MYLRGIQASASVSGLLCVLALLVLACGSTTLQGRKTVRPGVATIEKAEAAAGPAGPVEPCLALNVFKERLTADEFTQVQGLCKEKKYGATIVANVLTRLEFEPSWNTSLLLRMLASAIPEESDESLMALAKRLGGADQACSDVLKAFREDGRARIKGDLVLSPLREDTLGKACKGSVVFERKVFLVVPGAVEDQVDVAFRPPDKGWSVKRMTAFVDAGGFRYRFTQVPTGSRVIIRHASAGNAVAAQVHDVVVGSDYIPPASRDANARHCVQFEGRGPASLILLDGDVVPIGVRQPAGSQEFAARSFVRRGEHQFVILDSEGYVRAEARVQPDDLKQEGCYVRRFDVRPVKTSTLFVSAEPGCAEMGVVQARLYAYAKAYLGYTLPLSADPDETIDDLEPWTAAFSAIARLNGALTPMGRRQAGWERGNLDQRYVMQSLAGELLRRGFKRAYIGNLSCGQVNEEPSFTFVVHRLDLQEALSMTWGEETTAEQEKQVLVTQQETVTHLDDLRDLIRAPLARLLEVPYSRLISGGKKKTRVFHDPSVLIELWQPPERTAGAELKVLRSNDEYDTDRRCSDVLRDRRLINAESKAPHSDTKLDVVQVEYLDIPKADPDKENVGPWQRRVKLDVDSAGLYIVELPIIDGKQKGRPTRLCVQVGGDESRPRIAAQVGVSPGLYPTSGVEGSTVQSQIILSLSPAAGLHNSRAALKTPVLLGYTTLYRDATTPPSWNDLENEPVFTDDGTVFLSWTRKAVVLGFRTDFEYKLACGIQDLFRGGVWACSELLNRVKFYARGSLLLDAGLIEANYVPAAFRNFYDYQPTDTSIIDVDLTTAVQLGFLLRIGARMDLGIGAQVAWFGFDDFVGGDQASIRYDSLVAPGVTFEMGYHL